MSWVKKLNGGKQTIVHKDENKNVIGMPKKKFNGVKLATFTPSNGFPLVPNKLKL